MTDKNEFREKMIRRIEEEYGMEVKPHSEAWDVINFIVEGIELWKEEQ